jgi:competence protein ComEC
MAHGRLSPAVALAVVLVVAGCAGTGGPAAAPESPSDATVEGGAAPPTTSAAAGNESGVFEVHFLNVGQSVSTLLVAPSGETMLVDSGNWQDDGEYVLQYLRRQNVTRIDHLVTSHADADHIGGHAAVIEHYETEADGVGAVYDPGVASTTQTYDEYLDAVERYNVTLYRVATGDELPVAGVNATVLAPPAERLADGERNENSVVLSVDYRNHSFLFTGDAEHEEESYLLERYGARLNATVLKAGHHGSRSSTSGPLLDAVTPRVVVVSSAYESRYGHPHEETLDRLAARSIPTYWTAVHGHVVLESDGRGLTILTQRNATTVATDLRSAESVPPGSTDGLVVRERLDGGARGGERTTDSRTRTATPVATDGGSSPTATETPDAPSVRLSLVRVRADADGNDHENLDDEYVVFENAGESTLDLSGWTVRDAAGHSYGFPDGFALDPGDRVTLYTGSGTDTDDSLYWGSERAVWNNGGDTVTVEDDEGTVVLQETYE